MMTLEEIVEGAVGPFDEFCDGYGNSGATGNSYISVLKLETGTVEKRLDHILEGIVSYDRAEANGTYIGQINMIAASSFNGCNGAVWGYDLAKNEEIANGTLKPLFTKPRHDGVEVPVYSVEPLLDAGQRLFGTVDDRRFPIIPGGHAICAVKDETVLGPTAVWCAIALAIVEDPQQNSYLFIEDAGHGIPGDDEARVTFLSQLMENVVESVLMCGEDQQVKYKEVFVGYKTEWTPEGHVGCALTCAPYVVLAKNAIPQGRRPADLINMTISEWEKSVLAS